VDFKTTYVYVRIGSDSEQRADQGVQTYWVCTETDLNTI